MSVENNTIAAIWIIKVFIPAQDVKNWADWIEWNDDDWVLPTQVS